MYAISVKNDFIANHQLIGGDWGAENFPHAHHFAVEVLMEGATLNQHGYLFDIALVKERMTDLIGRYRDRLLNELPEFKGLNPSIEHFARIFSEGFTKGLEFPGVERLTIRMWEDENAWAQWTRALPK